MPRLFRFVVSGGAAALVYCFVLVQLTGAGLAPWLSGLLAYVVSMPVGFVLHKVFTFRSEQPFRQELPRFVATSLPGIFLGSVIPALLTATGRVPMPWVGLATSIATPVITYILMSIWVFKQPR